MEPRAAWLYAVFVRLPGGGEKQVELKAWRYQEANGESWTWELRRLVDGAGLVPDSMYLHQWVGRQRQARTSMWSELGFGKFEECVFPSSKAEASKAQKGGASLTASKYTRSEWSATTLASVSILLHASVASRLAKAKTQASAVLEALVRRSCCQAVLSVLRQSANAASVLSRCEAGAKYGVCAHMREVHVALALSEGASAICASLRKLYTCAAVCPGCASCLREVMLCFSRALEESVPECGHNDLKRAAAHDPSCKKRGRKDEDLIAQVLQGAHDKKVSPATFANVVECGSSRSGCDWEEQYALQMQSAASSAFEKSACAHVSLDAKRLGNPAEDTEAFLAYGGKGGTTMWLPPQVFVWRASRRRRPPPSIAGGGVLTPPPPRLRFFLDLPPPGGAPCERSQERTASPVAISGSSGRTPTSTWSSRAPIFEFKTFTMSFQCCRLFLGVCHFCQFETLTV